MPDSTSEQVLKALFAALRAGLPPAATVVRNETVPMRVPPGGWVCLRDGDPGFPEFLHSPPVYIYSHAAEADLVVELPSAAERDALFDRLKRSIGVVIAEDRTLGGLCDFVLGEAPVPVEVPVEGGANIKAASVGIILTYGTSDPLG